MVASRSCSGPCVLLVQELKIYARGVGPLSLHTDGGRAELVSFKRGRSG